MTGLRAEEHDPEGKGLQSAGRRKVALRVRGAAPSSSARACAAARRPRTGSAPCRGPRGRDGGPGAGQRWVISNSPRRGCSTARAAAWINGVRARTPTEAESVVECSSCSCGPNPDLSPTIPPTGVIHASETDSRPSARTALSATGTGCSAGVCVTVRNRVPAPPDSTRAFICVTLARTRRNRPRQGVTWEWRGERGGGAQSSPRKMLPSPVCAVVGPTRSSTAGRQVRRSPLPCSRRALDQPVSGRRATGSSTVCGVTALHRPSMLPSGSPGGRGTNGPGGPSARRPRTHIRRGSGAPELDGRPNRPARLRCWAVPR
jgi:hypothetical protein